MFEVAPLMGITFTNTSGERGGGGKNPKLSTRAQFQALSVQFVLKGVAV